MDIQDELEPLFDEQEALNNVLSAAFKPTVKEEPSLSVSEMYAFIAGLAPKSKKRSKVKHAFVGSEKAHALHGLSLNPDRHALDEFEEGSASENSLMSNTSSVTIEKCETLFEKQDLEMSEESHEIIPNESVKALMGPPSSTVAGISQPS